jgi:molybdenum cofactor synthesis domain-containing protein
MIKVAIVTVSDSCSRGKRDDVSGRTIEEMLASDIFEVWHRKVLPDEQDMIALGLTQLADRLEMDVVLTTGGTGLGPRDVTPEATESVCVRMVPGLSELMRAEGFKKTPNAMLSRAVAGIRGRTLIINLPGSPKAVRECLEVILPILPHAIEMMRGGGH